jgi:tRNA pseudouridine55 synthase
MRLGIKTDTQDATGTVTSSCSNYSVNEERLRSVFLKFTGDIQQIPPMYSAVKHKGVRLYTLARKGITVERKAKDVHIYKIELLDAGHEFIRFEAEVSSGTYIRTLCEQIGDELGCCGHLYELQRTVIGDFKINDSVSIEDVEALHKSGKLGEVLLSMN